MKERQRGRDKLVDGKRHKPIDGGRYNETETERQVRRKRYYET